MYTYVFAVYNTWSYRPTICGLFARKTCKERYEIYLDVYLCVCSVQYLEL